MVESVALQRGKIDGTRIERMAKVQSAGRSYRTTSLTKSTGLAFHKVSSYCLSIRIDRCLIIVYKRYLRYGLNGRVVLW